MGCKYVVAGFSIVIADVSAHAFQDGGEDPRTELDSHANMVVLGSNAYVFESSGRTCGNVKPFDSKLGTSTNIPIVDGALSYECPYTGKTYVLIARNALYIKHLRNNLIPPFIMREGGLTVSEKPKIHCNDPSVEDHSITFPDSSLRIPLQLSGIFSYFHTRKPTKQELYDCKKLFLTPDSNDWNPHCTSFESNERSMLDFRGEISEKSRWLKEPQMFDEEDDVTLSAITVEQWEQHVDANISSVTMLEDSTMDDDFARAINARGEVSSFGTSIGSCKYNTEPDREIFSMEVP